MLRRCRFAHAAHFANTNTDATFSVAIIVAALLYGYAATLADVYVYARRYADMPFFRYYFHYA